MMSAEIRELAENLRAALDRAKAADADIPWLARFPTRCCNFASNLLLLELSQAGIGRLRRVMGTVQDEKGDDLGTHVWVQSGDTIIDITADQFGQPNVIVEHQPDWHASLEDVKPFLPKQDLEEGVPADVMARLESLYEQALNTLASFRGAESE